MSHSLELECRYQGWSSYCWHRKMKGREGEEANRSGQRGDLLKGGGRERKREREREMSYYYIIINTMLNQLPQ